MKIIKHFLYFFNLCLVPFLSYAQTTEIQFVPTFNRQAIQLNTYQCLHKKDSILFTQIRFYISNIQFFSNTNLVYEDTLRYYLIDLSKPKSTCIQFNTNKINNNTYIRFLLGIDSITNSNGAHGAALDPTQGMYWTWQSGYINIKMEGHYQTNDKAKRPFTFHLGGFLNPNNAQQLIQLKLKNYKHIQIQMPLDACISSAITSNKINIMSPSLYAVQLSKIIAQSFLVK